MNFATYLANSRFPKSRSFSLLKFCEIFCIRSDISNFMCFSKFSRPHTYIQNAHMLDFCKFCVDQFTTSQSGPEWQISELLRVVYIAQILQSLSYKVCWIIIQKFNTLKLFILILGASTIMDQTACCYNVTTSETGLYSTQSVFIRTDLYQAYHFNDT